MKYKLNIGETISDGWEVWVMGRDRQYHYVGSGNHANYIVSREDFIKTLGFVPKHRLNKK